MDPTGEDEWSDWEDEETPVQSLLESKVLPSAKVSHVDDHDQVANSSCISQCCSLDSSHGTVGSGGSLSVDQPIYLNVRS